jgi:hypothetical protein
LSSRSVSSSRQEEKVNYFRKVSHRIFFLSSCLSVSPFVYLSFYLSVSLLYTFKFVCLSVCLLLCLYFFLFSYCFCDFLLLADTSVFLSIHISIFLSVCLLVYLTGLSFRLPALEVFFSKTKKCKSWRRLKCI